MLDPADWAAQQADNKEFFAALMVKAGEMNAEEWGDFTGQALFEVGMEVATAGGAAALTTLKAADKTVDDIIEITGKVCVFACFPAGTKIHTKNGLKNIEDINIGDLVWSWNESNDKIELKKVLNTTCDEADVIIELHTVDNIIRTTPTHPFKTDTEWKDAADLKVGDNVRTFEGTLLKISRVNHVPIKENVFNFSVEDFHTYYVGENLILVHNACYRKVFFETFPHLKDIVGQVHHAIPKDVFKKWPNLFDKKLMNSLENLRGIPKDGMYKLHQSAIHKEWNEFYKIFKDSGVEPTKEAVEAMAKKIDNLFGSQFNPPF